MTAHAQKKDDKMEWGKINEKEIRVERGLIQQKAREQSERKGD